MSREMQSPAIASTVAPAVLRYVASRGGDATWLAMRLGLAHDAIDRDELAVTADAMRDLLEGAADVLHEPGLALTLPDALLQRRYRFAELTARSSAHARDALTRLARYLPTLLPGLEGALDTGTDAVCFRVRTPGRARGLGRHVNEFALAWALSHVRRETGLPVAATRAWFSHARPRDLGALHRYFATTDLVFGTSDNGFALRGTDAALPLRSSDPRMLATVEPLAEAELSAVPSLHRIEPAVAAVITAHLPQVDIACVARALHVSARTLQRRLEAEGTSFGESLDGVRETMARRLLRDEGRTVADVAARLGFADAAAFGRAFKRWTGRPPGAFRTR